MKVDPVPSGWSATTLADVVEPKRVKINPSAETNLPFIGMEHVEPHSLAPHSRSEFRTMKSAASHFMRGDVLYGRMRPYLNKVFRADFEGAGSAEFIVFPRSDHLDSDFLKYLLHQKSFVSFASHETSGDRPRIDFDDIKTFRFLLPPANQQRRIVAKIDELFSDIEEGERCLARAQELLKRYRQSVLKAAVTGELTRDWRDRAQRGKNAGKGETGADLLRRILAARRSAWEKSGRGKAYIEAAPPEIGNLPNLPQGWMWANLTILSREPAANGISVRGKDKPPGVPALRLDAIQGGGLNYATRRYIEIDKHRMQRLAIASDDLFVSRANGSKQLCGKAARATATTEVIVFPDTMIRYRLLDLPFIVEWVNAIWPSTLVRTQIERFAKTSAGIWKVSQSDLARVVFPVPPESEREQIVSLLSTGFSSLLAHSDELQTSLEKAGNLRQSILRAAFSGKLVPQDPADEPASMLLERIAAARAGDPEGAAKPRARRR